MGELISGCTKVRPFEQNIHSQSLFSQRPSAVFVRPRVRGDSAVVVACPHSGRFYPDELRQASCLDAFTLRRSEDAFVDELFASAPEHGGDLLINRYARAFVDVNRCARELDSALIKDLSVEHCNKPTERVKAGLGVIPRTVGDGIRIYANQIDMDAVDARLAEVYFPWHEAVDTYLRAKQLRLGVSILLDCHSMPAVASGDPSVDIVLGDRFGASCAPLIMNEAMGCLRASGLKIGRNDPYAGGYSTIRHASVGTGRHALQIEINRSLYMVEGALTKRPCFDDIAAAMAKLLGVLSDVSLQLAGQPPATLQC
jgi:N-formylglutamate amidohydrolase